LHHLAEKGETMSKHREDFLDVLKTIDDKLHEEDDDERDKGADRLIAQVKEGLPTSSHLITWINSIKSRYPISTTTKWVKFMASTVTLLLSLLLFVFDVGTDSLVNKEFHENSLRRNNTNDTFKLCLEQGKFEDYLECQTYTGQTLLKCMNGISHTLAEQFGKCPGNKNDEVGRFAPEEWTELFVVTLVHIIFPWFVYWITACLFTHLVTQSTKQNKISFMKKIGVLLLIPFVPIVTKFRRYTNELKLTSLRAKEPKNPEVIKQTTETNKELEDCSENEAAMLLVEVSTEASFQFYIQTLLLLPNIILAVLKAYNNSEESFREEVINFRSISILSSFAVLSNSYNKIKNMKKKEALTGINSLTIFAKTTMDTLTRVTTIALFIYLTDPGGNFNTLLAVSLYYGHSLILLVFNIIFNTSAPQCSAKYFIGLLLNSLSSFFSYNYYNYDDILDKNSKKVKIQNHHNTFLRQGMFSMIFFCENLVLTVWTVIGSHGKMTDRFGTSHELSTGYVGLILLFVWTLQLCGFIMTVAYYGTHPASVSLTDIKSKLKIYIWGVHWVWKKGCGFVKGKQCKSNVTLLR
jgi:hypothetical protein